jgi:hypothetical protein
MIERRPRRNRLVPLCPVCGGELVVTHATCTECHTELSGRFVPNEFARLPEDKLDFLRTFLACRGNLKEVESALSLSYPTVRARLDQLIEALELQGRQGAESRPEGSVAILAALERGEITVDEAERLLRGT